MALELEILMCTYGECEPIIRGKKVTAAAAKEREFSWTVVEEHIRCD